jgi:hypothetical protein
MLLWLSYLLPCIGLLIGFADSFAMLMVVLCVPFLFAYWVTVATRHAQRHPLYSLIAILIFTSVAIFLYRQSFDMINAAEDAVSSVAVIIALSILGIILGLLPHNKHTVWIGMFFSASAFLLLWWTGSDAGWTAIMFTIIAVAICLYYHYKHEIHNKTSSITAAFNFLLQVMLVNIPTIMVIDVAYMANEMLVPYESPLRIGEDLPITLAMTSAFFFISLFGLLPGWIATLFIKNKTKKKPTQPVATS